MNATAILNFRSIFMKCLIILMPVFLHAGKIGNNIPPDVLPRQAGFSMKNAFVENKGQEKFFNGISAEDVKYTFNANGIRVILNNNGIAYQFMRAAASGTGVSAGETREFYRTDMILADCNTHAKIYASEPVAGTSIFRGEEREYRCSSFERVTYENIYPGIDWIVYLQDNFVKYDFVLKPGADVSLIKMQWRNANRVSATTDAGYKVINPLGSIREKKPFSYQNGKEIQSSFVLHNEFVSFMLGAYDRSKVLVIDPAIMWATYFGSTGNDHGYSTVTDNSGNVYLAGYTDSPVGIAVGGFQNSSSGVFGNGYLAKFNSSGVLQWSTYYAGSSSAMPVAVTCDLSGNVYLAGTTGYTSGVFASGHQSVMAGGGADAFLVKFNSSGARVWGTYYGGPSDDYGSDVSTDASGNVYLVGTTASTSGIPFGGFQNISSGDIREAFLVKFNSSGVRLWATYYGGTGYDYGNSCAVDGNGDVYIAGNTTSTLGIASGGFQNTLGGSPYSPDMFLAKFSAAGSRLWGTYYGGAGVESGSSCATDNNGNVFLTGLTESPGFALNGHQNGYGGSADALLVKFSSTGIRLWATYYGSNGFDYAYKCLSDNSGNVYLCGSTTSTANIGSLGFQNTKQAGTDAFFVKFNPNGTRLWGSYFGDAGNDIAYGCAIDNSNALYLVGNSTSTANIAAAGYQNSYGGGSNDGFLIKLCDSPSQPSAITGNTIICSNSPELYSASAVSLATQYLWSSSIIFSGTSTINSVSLSAAIPGTVAVTTLSVSAVNSCGMSIPATLQITVNATPTIAVSGGTICEGESYTITPSGASTYSVSGGTFTVSPASTSNYSIYGISSAGCVSANTVVTTVTVFSRPMVAVASGSICLGQGFSLTPSGAASYSYQNAGPVVYPSASFSYSVIGFNAQGCASYSPAIGSVHVYPQASITVNSGTICSGKSFTIVPQGALSYTVNGGQWVVSPTVSTSYTINAQGPGACPALVPAVSNITVYSAPVISVSSTSDTLCKGGTATLSATGVVQLLWDSVYVGSSYVVSPPASQVYTVSGTGLSGCPSVALFNLSVLPLPLIQVVAAPVTICEGSSATLTASGAVSYSWSNNAAGPVVVVSPPGTTPYLVSGTDTNGCTGTSSVTVNVEAIPSLTVSGFKPIFCRGEEVLLDASGASTFMWSTGSSGSQLSFFPFSDSLIFVTGYSPTGCSKTDSILVRLEECVGMPYNKTTSDILIFPNPAEENLQIKNLVKKQNIRIFDSEGKMVFERNTQESQILLNIAELVPGLYLVELMSGENVVTRKKFVKQ